jgi:hypothetical protein
VPISFWAKGSIEASSNSGSVRSDFTLAMSLLSASK